MYVRCYTRRLHIVVRLLLLFDLVAGRFRYGARLADERTASARRRFAASQPIRSACEFENDAQRWWRWSRTYTGANWACKWSTHSVGALVIWFKVHMQMPVPYANRFPPHRALQQSASSVWGSPTKLWRGWFYFSALWCRCQMEQMCKPGAITIDKHEHTHTDTFVNCV